MDNKELSAIYELLKKAKQQVNNDLAQFKTEYAMLTREEAEAALAKGDI